MFYKLKKLEKKSDDRGFLIEFLKHSEFLPSCRKKYGQSYLVTFKRKNKIRGNHYHKTRSEWFVLAQGSVEVKLKDLKTGRQIKIILDDKSQKYLKRLYIAPMVVHSFRSLEPHTMMLNYTDKEWRPDNEDTYFYEL